MTLRAGRAVLALALLGMPWLRATAARASTPAEGCHVTTPVWCTYRATQYGGAVATGEWRLIVESPALHRTFDYSSHKPRDFMARKDIIRPGDIVRARIIVLHDNRSIPSWLSVGRVENFARFP